MSALPSILLAQSGTAIIRCTVWLGLFRDAAKRIGRIYENGLLNGLMESATCAGGAQ